MIEDTAPTEDIRATLEALRAKVATELQSAVESGGKKTVRHRCTKCGETNTVEVSTFDPDMLVKSLSSSSAALKALGDERDETSREATKLRRDLADMTSEELAEYIIRLRSDLGQPVED